MDIELYAFKELTQLKKHYYHSKNIIEKVPDMRLYWHNYIFQYNYYRCLFFCYTRGPYYTQYAGLKKM